MLNEKWSFLNYNIRIGRENITKSNPQNLVGWQKVNPVEFVNGKFPPTCGAFLLRLNRSFDASLTEKMATNCWAWLSQCVQANRTGEGHFFWYHLFRLYTRINHSLSLQSQIIEFLLQIKCLSDYWKEF